MSEGTSSEISPLSATTKGRCPRCGKGKLYSGVIKLSAKCDSCDLELAAFDQADGPAPFVMMIVGTLVAVQYKHKAQEGRLKD